jgi:hypothetical protein
LTPQLCRSSGGGGGSTAKCRVPSAPPRPAGEAFNVLKYVNQQHYDSHMDSFDPKEYGSQPSQRIATVLLYLSEVEAGGETVFKKEGVGGERPARRPAGQPASRPAGQPACLPFAVGSWWPLVPINAGLPKQPLPWLPTPPPCPTSPPLTPGESRIINDWRNCNDGSFKYAPRQGDAVLFWDVKPDLTIDTHSLHGGCPVIKGEKWAMTKWIHNTRQQGDNY